MHSTPTLDIVLPCYNPAPGWTERVMQAWQQLQTALPHPPRRLILVNDGSTKGIGPDDIASLTARIPGLLYLPSTPNHGKGYALRLGVQASDADLLIYTDIDFPYTEASLVQVATALYSGGADVVPGVRPDAYYEGVPADRRRISRLLRWLLRNFLRLKITDTQCGLKGFNRAGRAVFLQTSISRFLFDLEFIFLASQRPDIRLQAVEVILKPGIQFSHVSLRVLLREGFNFLRVFLRALAHRLRG
jgi:glycosyltransferase involved in cell wall biosynthesis